MRSHRGRGRSPDLATPGLRESQRLRARLRYRRLRQATVSERIRVNCVTPGTAGTPWVARLLDAATDPAAEHAALAARQPMGRLVSADEVAAAIGYLASPLASATTGTVLAVDGGVTGLRIRPSR